MIFSLPHFCFLSRRGQGNTSGPSVIPSKNKWKLHDGCFFHYLLRPCYNVQFSQQLVSQCHCKTSCWRIAQCNKGCLAMFLLREVLHEVELSSTFRNGLQQLTIPLHSVSPLQQLVSQFYGSFNKGVCAHFLFFFARSIARHVAEKIA